MDCCRHYQGLNDMFNSKAANAQLEKYLKKGLDKAGLFFVETIAGCTELRGKSVLDVGGGLGFIHQEMLRHGTARALEVEIATASLTAARTLAEKLGTSDRVEYIKADFALEAEKIPSADIVMLSRVICCYPDMPSLLRVAARHAGSLLALSVPRSDWYMRLFGKLVNFIMRMVGSRFRFYVHNESDITSLLSEAGLTLARQVSAWPWRIAIYTAKPY